jgi:hypothetical protein
MKPSFPGSVLYQTFTIKKVANPARLKAFNFDTSMPGASVFCNRCNRHLLVPLSLLPVYSRPNIDPNLHLNLWHNHKQQYRLLQELVLRELAALLDWLRAWKAHGDGNNLQLWCVSRASTDFASCINVIPVQFVLQFPFVQRCDAFGNSRRNQFDAVLNPG